MGSVSSSALAFWLRPGHCRRARPRPRRRRPRHRRHSRGRDPCGRRRPRRCQCCRSRPRPRRRPRRRPLPVPCHPGGEARRPQPAPCPPGGEARLCHRRRAGGGSAVVVAVAIVPVIVVVLVLVVALVAFASTARCLGTTADECLRALSLYPLNESLQRAAPRRRNPLSSCAGFVALFVAPRIRHCRSLNPRPRLCRRCNGRGRSIRAWAEGRENGPADKCLPTPKSGDGGSEKQGMSTSSSLLSRSSSTSSLSSPSSPQGQNLTGSGGKLSETWCCRPRMLRGNPSLAADRLGILKFDVLAKCGADGNDVRPKPSHKRTCQTPNSGLWPHTSPCGKPPIPNV